MNIKQKAVEYGTLDLQQIDKIDRLLKEERNKVLDEVKNSLPEVPQEQWVCNCGKRYKYDEMYFYKDKVSTIIDQLKLK